MSKFYELQDQQSDRVASDTNSSELFQYFVDLMLVWGWIDHDIFPFQLRIRAFNQIILSGRFGFEVHVSRLQRSSFVVADYLGLRPRLVWGGPLALRQFRAGDGSGG